MQANFKQKYKQVVTKEEPEKSLTKPLKNKAGRSKGKITVRRRGGGAKRLYRVIDWAQDKKGQTAEVLALEYDPNRSGFIALVKYEDGEKGYILAPQEIEVGDQIEISDQAELKPGNRMKLKNIPPGTMVYNVELKPGRGGQIARSAGTGAKVLAHKEKFVHLELPSTEIRKINKECFANIGEVSKPWHRFIKQEKAGTVRHKGKRPKVRGTAMNAVDHPHGGGEGKAPIGLVHPKTPWGKPTRGVKTRKKKKSDKYIVERRK